jgi:hypothetical protein
MIVNPPRSEVELSPRLKAISEHATDKNEDPDDRPPLIPVGVRRRIIVVGTLLFIGLAIRAGLWVMIEHPVFSTRHADMANTYRQLARDAEADSKVYRSVVATGKPATLRNGLVVSDPVISQRMAVQCDMLAKTYWKQVLVEERQNLGLPVR